MFYFRLFSAPPLSLSETSVPPRDLRCSAAGSTSLLVSWALAAEELLGYEVRFGSGSDPPQTLRLEPGAGQGATDGPAALESVPRDGGADHGAGRWTGERGCRVQNG